MEEISFECPGWLSVVNSEGLCVPRLTQDRYIDKEKEEDKVTTDAIIFPPLGIGQNVLPLLERTLNTLRPSIVTNSINVMVSHGKLLLFFYLVCKV